MSRAKNIFAIPQSPHRESFFLPAVLRGDLSRKMRDQRHEIFRTFAQRRQHKWKNVDAMKEITPERILFDELFQVAVCRDHDTNIHFYRLVAANTLDLPSSKTRRSFACMATGMSPISSRKSVPPSACSNLPVWREAAPVNAPFSWPKSSDSIARQERQRNSK